MIRNSGKRVEVDLLSKRSSCGCTRRRYVFNEDVSPVPSCVWTVHDDDDGVGENEECLIRISITLIVDLVYWYSST